MAMVMLPYLPTVGKLSEDGCRLCGECYGWRVIVEKRKKEFSLVVPEEGYPGFPENERRWVSNKFLVRPGDLAWRVLRSCAYPEVALFGDTHLDILAKWARVQARRWLLSSVRLVHDTGRAGTALELAMTMGRPENATGYTVMGWGDFLDDGVGGLVVVDGMDLYLADVIDRTIGMRAYERLGRGLRRLLLADIEMLSRLSSVREALKGRPNARKLARGIVLTGDRQAMPEEREEVIRVVGERLGVPIDVVDDEALLRVVQTRGGFDMQRSRRPSAIAAADDEVMYGKQVTT